MQRLETNRIPFLQANSLIRLVAAAVGISLVAASGVLLVEAQGRARALVEADPELSGAGVTRIRELMDHRYAERLKLFSVG